MTLSCRGQNASRLVCLVVAGVLALALLGLLNSWDHEPVYKGKLLTDWLYDKNYTIWMPNDVYGHIHNELWEALVAGGYAAQREAEPAFRRAASEPADTAIFATRQVGTKAIPRLLELISSQPGLPERCTAQISRFFPNLGPFLDRHEFFRSVEAQRIAGWKGFGALGTNAESALPALENMLRSPQADFLLSSTIAEIGPMGRDVLVTALTNQNNNTVDAAAFALGCLGPAARTSAVPVLVDLVTHGRASYQVLGAIGRLGGHPDLVIPALSTYLADTNILSQVSLEQEMAMLILGLYGEDSRCAVPVLIRLYQTQDTTTRQVIRVVLKHIDPQHVQEHLGRAPTERDDADPWWSGAVE